MPPENPVTVLLQAVSLHGDVEVYRHIGIDGSLHLKDLHRVLDTCFGLIDDPASARSWHFSAGGEDVDAGDRILSVIDDHLTYHWGLWQVDLSAVGTFPRDAHTPWALCVGGSGSFRHTTFDLPAINTALTGQVTIRAVLQQVAPGARSIIERSELFDFVPLLQALDLAAVPSLERSVVAALGDLPVEQSPVQVDAFWCVMLGLACFSEETLTDEVVTSAMAALGHGSLSGSQVRALCADSLAVLASVGGYGPEQLPPVDRLEIYREVLRGNVAVLIPAQVG
ncbi:hypothetical protein [Corynebacterium lowii]|uniref:Uncharacterized protein n=1 Tax=Corynebacterium lowii TaxID=1544413 RepID=A0A0Q0ULE8_9CORY|nr:hypothetical protein [Corynebacterium lowii]KQB87153.1 hypothetical protein Clow_00201 [Corynebacterium lowii]MDP9852261.1 hypothetical protein [Corynebacterium lowii]